MIVLAGGRIASLVSGAVGAAIWVYFRVACLAVIANLSPPNIRAARAKTIARGPPSRKAEPPVLVAPTSLLD
jgi:hypothetical protein